MLKCLNDKDFEIFLIKQVRREYAMYFGIMIAFGFCAAASAVMAIAAPIMFGRGMMSTSLKLIALALFFCGICYADINMLRSISDAAEEMTVGLNHPECSIPDDYTDKTKDVRERVCRNLRSITGLIISYGIISIMLWGAAVIIGALGGFGTDDIDMMFICASLIIFAMALAMSILTISYIWDIPAARRYRELIAQGSEDRL